MGTQIQDGYEQRLDRYAAHIHGNVPPGLVAKLAIYSSLLNQQSRLGDRFWRIEPLLGPLIRAVEVDLHLAAAKLLEDPRRSKQSLFKFLAFCLANRDDIRWMSGSPSAAVIQDQLDALEKHRTTITTIMARRDKFFAHLDRKYFVDPAAVYADFPLKEQAVIALVNCVIDVVSIHQRNLRGSWSFHVAEFYEIGVDNMIRNLEAGRKANFPGQLD